MTDSKKNKKSTSWVQTGIGILAAILALLIVVMMYLVSGIQARPGWSTMPVWCGARPSAW